MTGLDSVNRCVSSLVVIIIVLVIITVMNEMTLAPNQVHVAQYHLRRKSLKQYTHRVTAAIAYP